MENLFFARLWPEVQNIHDESVWSGLVWRETNKRLLDLVAAMYLLSDGKQSKKAMCLQGDLLFLTQIAQIREVIG